MANHNNNNNQNQVLVAAVPAEPSPYRKMADLYEKHETLGRGAYGEVFKGRNRQTQEVVALKKIRTDEDEEGIPATALREIALLKKLNCDHIVKLKDVVLEETRLHVVFECMSQDLKTYIDSIGGEGMDPKILNSFAKQMLCGLAECHSRLIIHRDLKPQNLLVDARGYLKLADFGLARSFKTPIHKFTHEVVTMWYRAPEILLGSDHYSTAVDLWAAACIIAEMSNLVALFPGQAEIDQLFQVFRILGTPTEATWPGVSSLPYFQDQFPRFLRRSLTTVLPHLDPMGIDLLEQLFRFEPSTRLTAKESLEHPFFKTVSDPDSQ